jgi:hypothetical protein
MNEATPCCKNCDATVSSGRCMAGCQSFNYEKYDRYHLSRAHMNEAPVPFVTKEELRLARELKAVREQLARAESALDRMLSITYLKICKDMREARLADKMTEADLFLAAADAIENAYPSLISEIIRDVFSARKNPKNDNLS